MTPDKLTPQERYVVRQSLLITAIALELDPELAVHFLRDVARGLEVPHAPMATDADLDRQPLDYVEAEGTGFADSAHE